MPAKRKTARCETCGESFKSPQSLGAHRRQTGHGKDNGPDQDLSALVSSALKAVDGEMRRLQKKLERIRKILDE